MWESFDAVYCINLKERSDRYNRMKDLFEKNNISVKFYQTERHPNSGAQGCFESHINIIREAYNLGAPNCVIFEDDIEITPFATVKNFKKITNFISDKNNEWDLFYLGICPDWIKSKFPPKHLSNGFIQLKSICAHAYIISRKFMKRIKDCTFNGVPIDDFYCYATDQSYSLSDSLFIQGNYGSDISVHNFGWVKPFWFKTVVPFYISWINLTVLSLLILVSIGLIGLLFLYIINPQKYRYLYLLILFLALILVSFFI